MCNNNKTALQQLMTPDSAAGLKITNLTSPHPIRRLRMRFRARFATELILHNKFSFVSSCHQLIISRRSSSTSSLPTATTTTSTASMSSTASNSNDSGRTASATAAAMRAITDIRFGPLPPDSPYVKPFRMYFKQNGVEKNWDLLKVHDSVTIIIFNTSSQRLVFVRQFRPAVYYGLLADANGKIEQPIDTGRFPASLGVTVELCAGIVDKNKPFVEIAREEVLEECGYDVPVGAIEEIMTYRSGVGASGALQKLYYCEVTDAMRQAGGGGGVDDELIECVEVGVEEARAMVAKGADNPSPPSFLLGVLWFLANRAPGAKRSNL